MGDVCGLAGQLVDAVADRPADTAVAERDRREGRQRHGAGDRERDDADPAPHVQRRHAARLSPTFTSAPGDHQARATISTTSSPNSPATLSLTRERLGGDREGVLGERPGGDRRRRRSSRQGDQRQRAQAQRDDREPGERADRRRPTSAPRDWVSRIARIAAPSAGVGEHAADDAPPRRVPSQSRPGDRQRGGRADRVPVLERLPDPVGDLGLADRAGPDARGQRVEHGRHRGEHDPRDHRGRRARRQPRRRRPRRRRRPGRRACGPPRRRRATAPPPRSPTARSARASAANSATLVAPWSGPGRLQAIAAATTAPPDEHQQHLDDRRAAQLAAAGGTEGDAREGAAEDYFSDARSVGTEHAGSGSWTGAARARARDAAAQRDEHAGHREQAERDQRDQQRHRAGRCWRWRGRTGRSSPGSTVSPPTSTLGRARVAGRRPARSASSCVVLLAASPAPSRTSGLPSGPGGPGGPPPLSDPLVIAPAEHLAAVAVLVAVGRQVVERLLQLGVRVAAGRGRCRACSRSARSACAAAGSASSASTPSKNRFRTTRITLRNSSSGGGRGRTRADGNGIGTSHTAPRRLATVTAATVSAFQPGFCPGHGHR